MTVPEQIERLCTSISQCLASVPDMPSGLREAADNLRRSLLRNYPATQAAPSDVPSETIFPLSGETLPASAQAKIDSDIDARLKQIQYAAEAGRDTLRMKEELRVLAGGDRALENRIAEAIRRGKKAREERNRLKMLLNQELLSPAVGEYWDELPRRADWFINKASKEIRWHAAKELQSLLKKQGRDAGAQWLARAKARFAPVLDDLELSQPEELAAPVIPENTEHRLDRMLPARCWHIYIDESGQAFSEEEARQGAEGRVVAVCMRDDELLPEQRLHCTDSSPAAVLTALAALLKHPCGILGLSQTTLHVRSEDGWLQSIRELVKWIWRLLPLPDNGQPSYLRIHIEQRGQYGVATDTIFGKDMLRAELTRENPERAAKIRILSFDFIDKNDLRSGWADVASYCWGSRQPRIREGISRSGLLDTCLSRISPAVERNCHDIMTGKNPDGTAWQRLMEAHTPRSPFTGMALDVLRQRCLASPELWTPYAQAMQNYLLSKSYELSVLERMAEWLEGMKNPGREARYFWYAARLAHLNHKGDVASDTLLEVKHHLALLAPEMGATDPVAELHVALRLAVSEANAFDFAGAESRLARWNPAEGGRLPDTPLWRGKVLSSLGQYRAFQRDLPAACRYFRQALEQFSLLPEEEAARRSEAGAKGASGRPVDGAARPVRDACRPVQGGPVGVQHTGRHDADHRVYNLLNDLGNGRGHHGSHALEIAPQHAHDSHDEDRQSQHLQAELALRRVQKSSCKKSGPEEGQGGSEASHHQGHAHGRLKRSPGVPVLSHGHLGRHHLGHRQGKAVGGDQEDDIVDLVSGRIIIISLIPDDVRDRNPVQHPDDAADDGRRRQNASLQDKIGTL